MSFDFDRAIDRTGTHSVKHDGRAAFFGTDDVLPLWVADMDFAAPEAVTRALLARAAHPVYGYTLYPDGLFAALRDWFRQRHLWAIERESILMAPGVVASLHAAVQAFTRPGEGVIVQPPVYYPFFSAVTASGRELVLNPLREDRGRWTMDFADLERRAAAGARMLLLCSPHNPVGRVWGRDELEELLGIARRHRLTILSDEIHADLVYPGHRHLPLATLAGAEEVVVTAVAPSKTFNIPGLGLSALIAPDPARRAALQAVFERHALGHANPFGIAAFEAAYRDGAAWLDALLVYLRDTRDAVAAFLAARLPRLRLTRPEGTYLLWLDCRELGLEDGALRDFFIREARVGLNPGISYGAAGSGFMRLNIGAPRRLVTEALERMAAAVDRRSRARAP